MFDKITTRLQRLVDQFNIQDIDTAWVTQQVVAGLYSGVHASQIDQAAADVCISYTSRAVGYARLASVLTVSNHHKLTNDSFVDTLTSIDCIRESIKDAAIRYKTVLDRCVDYTRDYQYDYFGFKTLLRGYLLKDHTGRVVERPQHMLMRVACELYLEEGLIEDLLATYNSLSTLEYTHATPTLFNACLSHNQLASCFLVHNQEDSIEGIFDTLKTCATISKHAGGIGLAVHNVRSKHSRIRGTNGTSNGLVPMLKVFEQTARYVDQGGGKRKGSIAIYLEPWHADILDFVELGKKHGPEELRAPDLFYAMWIPDLFMRRVESDEYWSLFDPNTVGYRLSQLYGDEFDNAYCELEQAGMAVSTIPARELMTRIVETQIETGTPYMLYKDQCNRCSNHANRGTLKSSNLCCEILEFTDEHTIAVCNLASINLNRCVRDGTFDMATLDRSVRRAVRNINRLIDTCFYPDPRARTSNLDTRPMGIGVQGLADVFFKLDLVFTEPRARELNRRIFEQLYYSALDESIDLARLYGPYPSFKGSPLSMGKLHFDLYGRDVELTLDWTAIRRRLAAFGARNSLLIALMPTASTAQIMGNYESFEPVNSNMFVRSVISGDFMVVNHYLVEELAEKGMWTSEMKDRILSMGGSVQMITDIDARIREKYRTVWEIPQKELIDMAAERGAFVDQSQSFNVHFETPTVMKITSMHRYAWKSGMKTGSYYIRTKAAADPVKFSVKPTLVCVPGDQSCEACSA